MNETLEKYSGKTGALREDAIMENGKKNIL